MAVLGIVLIALAVLFGLGVSVSSTASTKLEVFGVDFGVSVPTVFFLGALAGAALIFGLWLLKKGLGRGYRRRKEMRELRAQATTTPSDTVGGEITEGDTSAPALETAGDTPADERLASEQELAPDPNDTKQPH
ncbi:hypothetical protein ACFWUU_31030 [Kribbella sp. NPDC058693]|uniref:Lipopolysaccharide assembly protein A domain-containing protein n=1 Tax=Kribbella jiaozuonensis TaxID=2575441 RepID=A0A4U3M2M7_9ACTN|nr:hypothetical protein [Kribbella jiaozuonensis]TKK81477.1 hypothetical protein FDA38_01050 [Kribbella jiaozuonensis]